ncbi:MAG TPA: GNAT family N-acetyltransferase [Kineosporiaceae bacterium]|nr:GNAT family N-acetyltransferase [Kineosporiaceae bacterium]
MPGLADLALDTPRLRLRPVAPDDAGALYAIFSDPQVMRYWSTPPWNRPALAGLMVRADVEDAAAGRAVRLAVLRLEDEDLIGTVSLFHLDRGSRRAEIGYALRRDAWGHGYAGEAAAAVVGYAFTGLDLNRLEADIDPRNEASARLLDRLGFRQEGLLRQRWIVADEICDSAWYGLLREDWTPPA